MDFSNFRGWTIAYIFMTLLYLVVILPGTVLEFSNVYTFKGVTELPVEQALALQMEHGNEQVTITAYNSESDAILVTFNFKSNQNVEYSIEGQFDTFWATFRWVIVGAVCCLLPITALFITIDIKKYQKGHS